MNSINSELLISMFNSMADAMDNNRDHLCELDGAIGDADHGITMSLGFTAVRKALVELDSQSAKPADVFNTAAKSFLKAVGASAGPLYATAFMRAGASCKGLDQLDQGQWCAAIEAMAEGIKHRGKAELGDKTMLDAWIPAATAAASSDAKSIDALMTEVVTAAKQGANDTTPLQAKKGRSAKLGERSIGHMDAGAASTALLLDAMARTLTK